MRAPQAFILMRPEPKFRRDSFVQGFSDKGYRVYTGITPRDIPYPELDRDDVLVIWTKHHARYEQVADHFEKNRATVLVVENGYFYKDPFNQKDYFAISRHDHNGAGNFYVGGSSRWNKLGIKLHPWRLPIQAFAKDKRHVLVREQRGIGSKVMASPPEWRGTPIINKVNKFTTRPVRFRRHPGAKVPATPSTDDLENCWVLVTWASSLGVRALTFGIPVIYQAPYWVGSDCCGSDLSCIDNPVMGDRYKTLCKVAWGQWHHNEIANGTAFEYLLEGKKDDQCSLLSNTG